MSKNNLLAVSLLILTVGCSKQDNDVEIDNTQLMKMEQSTLLKLAGETNNSKNRLRAIGIIAYRLAQKNRRNELSITDYTLIDDVYPWISHKDPKMRTAALDLLSQLKSHYPDIKSAEVKRRISPSVCQIRRIMLQLKKDPDNTVRYKVVYAMMFFPQNMKRTYADIKELENDPDAVVRQHVNLIKRAADSPTAKTFDLDCE